jgi:ABC-type phosphate transport system auxiliary subunit
MPVTARLSKAFYERLGDQVANELVGWFNAVDATYRTELRELNDLNFARFDAKLEQRIAEVKAELHQEIGALRTELGSLRADLMKWMFLYWAGTALTVIGLLRFWR